MADEPRITDHDEVLQAARADAGREGARFVYMTIGELWRLIHRAPELSYGERKQLGLALRVDE